MLYIFEEGVTPGDVQGLLLYLPQESLLVGQRTILDSWNQILGGLMKNKCPNYCTIALALWDMSFHSILIEIFKFYFRHYDLYNINDRISCIQLSRITISTRVFASLQHCL